MSLSASELRKNMDLLGGAAGLFTMIFIWLFIMIPWDNNRNTYLSNNENFQLMLSIFIFVPLFFFSFIMFLRGLYNLILTLAFPEAEPTK